ncbi:MAG: histidine--tRNA ligase [Deltaproteobacteria bacterium]|nr:histidine--tRNA ligase [Deltaproteobacteria bacterium]
MDQLRAVKGMDDLFESDLSLWRHVELVARETFLAYGFGEIRTPILEETAVFVRGVGEGTDIVHKEMFTFDDGGRPGDKDGTTSVCLRPENTAGVVRAMLEHGKLFADAYEQVFYVGPMFRREQPQAGRRRQFHQIGCEAFGTSEPGMDVAVMACVHTILDRLGLSSSTKLLLNTLGDPAERRGYTDALVAYFSAHEARLSDDSRRRLKENPLRILDSKDAGDRALAMAAPRPVDFLSDAARAHFDAVCAGLTRLSIPFSRDPFLVRGLDYYTRTVFEFVGEAGLGAQSTVAAGGRYDGLVETLGGRPTPAVGFAGGVERLVLMLKAVGAPAHGVAPELALVGADDGGRALCEQLAFGLRRQGVRVVVDVRGRGVKAQMKSADKSGARHSVVVGSAELGSGQGRVKNMATGDVSDVALSVEALRAVVRAAHAGG